ncbi:carbohydrate ABC transporter permease [Cohnella silvisoli]|uniref:Sugar ABC transporter permease n=1 Tax=Cohnella silvisoli TaxID=2873699 RepID=A0ABV1KSG5_9BACL|nr:sugar ABC transporter permease [Cohnella silvisoli]MCD9021292.1 sugar ABC transporter permease [Cohnella silvisoli]
MSSFYNNRLALFLFSAPTLILFTLFVVYPLFPQIRISFFDHDGINYNGFVGLDNYRDVLHSSEFWHSAYNNVKIVLISTFVGLPISLLLALVLDRMSPGIRRYFRMTSFMPAVLSVTVIAQMWIAMFEPRFGALNQALSTVGLGDLKRIWLGDPETALPSVAFAFLWQYIGLNMVLFYTGIKSIPKTYYEAALIDGAGFFQTNVRIVLPLLQEVVKFVLVISVIGCLRQFEHVKMMTNGGPGSASRTVIYELYYRAFNMYEFGVGSVIAILFVVACLLITFMINNLVAREKMEF